MIVILQNDIFRHLSASDVSKNNFILITLKCANKFASYVQASHFLQSVFVAQLNRLELDRNWLVQTNKIRSKPGSNCFMKFTHQGPSKNVGRDARRYIYFPGKFVFFY